MATKTTELRGKLRLMAIVGFSLMALVIGGLVALFLLDIEDVIYAHGKIDSEITYDIIGHMDSRVVRLNFDEGDDVKAGDVIARLDTIQYDERLVRLDAEEREFEAELEVKKAALAALRINPLPKELWFAETNLKESEGKASRTAARVRRWREVTADRAISRHDFEDAEIENIQAQGALARARETLALVRGGLGQRNIEKAERDIDLVRTRIAGCKAERKLVERRLADCRIVAPNSGRLVSLPCKYTRYVEKGVVAAKLSCGNTLKGIAYVDENVVRKVRPGQAVRISSGVFNRLEYGAFYGLVNRVYDTPLPSSGGSPTRYPVEIAIDSRGRPIRLGSSADFAIVTGREPVIYTILNLTQKREAEKSRESR